MTKLFNNEVEKEPKESQSNKIEHNLKGTKRLAKSLDSLNEESEESADQNDKDDDDDDDIVVKLLSTLQMKKEDEEEPETQIDDVSIVRENMQSLLLDSSESSDTDKETKIKDQDSPSKMKNVHFASANRFITAMSISKRDCLDSLEAGSSNDKIKKKIISDDLDCEAVSLSIIYFLSK